jgi:hypothetical protein
VGQSLVSGSGAFSSFSSSFSAFLASSNARLVLLRFFSRRSSSVLHIHAVIRAFLNLRNASPTGVARKSSKACWYRISFSVIRRASLVGAIIILNVGIRASLVGAITILAPSSVQAQWVYTYAPQQPWVRLDPFQPYQPRSERQPSRHYSRHTERRTERRTERHTEKHTEQPIKHVRIVPTEKPTVHTVTVVKEKTWQGMSQDDAREWIKNQAVTFCEKYKDDKACQQKKE